MISPERASWNVHDADILAELLNLMGLSSSELQLLGELQPHARTVAPRMSAAFYERLLQHANTAEYLPQAQAAMEQRHTALQQWFIELFDGVYDQLYAQRRIRIGYMHVHAGIPVRYPLAMLDVIIPAGEEVTQQSTQPEQARIAFHKVLALDVAVFNQAYEDIRLHYLAELVSSRRLARRLLMDGS